MRQWIDYFRPESWKKFLIGFILGTLTVYFLAILVAAIKGM